MSTEDRKLRAIVFTDICGFTELMGRNEAKALALLEQQRSLLKPIIHQFNGEWLKEIGDGVLIAFPSAVKAVTCALEIQRILAHNPELTLRIGIHIGDVVKKDGDVFGDGVNIASRLEPLAEPGGICVSERVHEDIKNKPEISTSFQEEQLLKGVDKPIKVYSIFTQMGSEPQQEEPKHELKESKSKLPILAAGLALGLLITVFALKQSGSGSSSALDNSLAVFNFENLSAENENDRTGQILQELIITDLSGINDFKIFSSQRLFDIQKQMGSKDSRYIDPSMALDIAREAGASSMMTGNIIKVGNTVVLTSRLLDVNDGSVIQSRKVEGTDIYVMVDQLSSYVIEDLNLGIIETVDLAVSEKTSSNMTAYNYFISGNDLLNNGNFNEAVVELQKAVNMDPTFKKAMYKLAIAQWWAKGVDVASSDSATIATLDRYLALPNISDDEIKVAKGVKNIVTDKFIDALETFEYLVELHPDNKEYQYLLGECLFHGTDNSLKALRSFEKAIHLDPEFELANIHLIDLYMLEKRFDKTITMLEGELEKNPNSTRSLWNLAHIKLRQGLSEEGMEIANQILEIDSTHFYAKFGKIYGLIELNRFDEAEPLILALRKESNNRFESFMLKNGFYFIQGKYLERRDELLKVFNKKSLDKKDAFSRQLLARLILISGNLSKNIEMLKKDVKLFSDVNNPEFGSGNYIDFLFVMHWANAILGKTESSDHYHQMMRDYIIDNELINSWPKEYILSLEIEEAYYLHEWNQIITKIRKFSDNLTGQLFREIKRNRKCEAEFHLKKYDLALLTAGKMISPDQDYRAFLFYRPFGYYWQGRIYEEQGKMADAIDSYEKLMELWKDGDERIPERKDTAQRLKNLRKTI